MDLVTTLDREAASTPTAPRRAGEICACRTVGQLSADVVENNFGLLEMGAIRLAPADLEVGHAQLIA